MLETLGFDKTVLGVANYYRDIIDILVIDTMDACYKTDIEKLGIETWVMPVIMRNETERKELAKSILSKSDFMKG